MCPAEVVDLVTVLLSVRMYARMREVVALRTKRFTHLSYTWLVVELEHLKIKTRLTNEKFANVNGECAI